MKCPNCGSSKFSSVKIISDHSLISATEGYTDVRQNVNALACEKCGRVELYMPNGWAEQLVESRKKAAEKVAKENELKEKIAKLQNEREKLEKFVKDENNTVKEIKEATAKLNEVCSELKKLGVDLNRAVHPVGNRI